MLHSVVFRSWNNAGHTRHQCQVGELGGHKQVFRAGQTACPSQTHLPFLARRKGLFFFFLSSALGKRSARAFGGPSDPGSPTQTFSACPFLPYPHPFLIWLLPCAQCLICFTHLPSSQRIARSKSVEPHVLLNPGSLFAYICMALCGQGLAHHCLGSVAGLLFPTPHV